MCYTVYDMIFQKRTKYVLINITLNDTLKESIRKGTLKMNRISKEVEEVTTGKVYVECLGKVFNLAELQKTQGTYKHEGKTLWLIQDSYPSDLCGHENEYTAVAINIKGNMYCVTWDIINYETGNKLEPCNWDNYKVKII